MKNYTLIFLSLLIFSCKKENNENPNTNLVITMGTICGWCADGDSLVINETTTKYTAFNPCSNAVRTIDSLTAASVWSRLINLLDLNTFENINIYTCYYCADGCDTWVSVKSNSFSHTIRFGDLSTQAIQSIRPFINKLDSIRIKFSH